MADVSYGDDAPQIVNVIIEIQKGGRNKFEVDKDTGRLFLDRVNAALMGYPADYGYVPDTLCEDGDPIDALVIIDERLPHGVVVPCRPVGILYFEDEGEMDEKLICVAADDITKSHIKTLDDLGETFKKQVEHFYAHYKDWKKDWNGVKGQLQGWGGPEEAQQTIQKSIEAAKN